MPDLDMGKAVAEGWASLPPGDDPSDGYDIHPVKYWKGRFSGSMGAPPANGGSYGGGATQG